MNRGNLNLENIMNSRSRIGWAALALAVSLNLGTSGWAQSRDGNWDANWSGPNRAPLASNDAEVKVLNVLAEMSRNPRERYLSVSAQDGRLLRQLTQTAGAKRVVEIGTSTGYSGLWFCLALQATDGKLITHELDPERAAVARQHFQQAGVADRVTIVVGDAHQTVTRLKEPIDVLFLDADKEGYIDYLQKLLPLVRPGGLILAHNMNRPTPDPRYIQAITANPNLETTFLLMDGSGVGVTLKKQ